MKKVLSLSLSLSQRVRMHVSTFVEAYARMFSRYMGEEISPSTVLKVTHAVIAFTILVFSYGNVFFSLLTLGWFIVALLDCKKAGIV